MHRNPLVHRASTLALTAVAALLSTTALAADPAAPSAQEFPNVTFIDAPVATPAAAPSLSSTQGRMVFVDPATGKRHLPTPEELGAANAKPAAKSSLRAKALAVRTVSPRAGGRGITVNPSMMKFAVATRNADGTVSEMCVPGEADAAHASHAHPLNAVAGGTNVR